MRDKDKELLSLVSVVNARARYLYHKVRNSSTKKSKELPAATEDISTNIWSDEQIGLLILSTFIVELLGERTFAGRCFQRIYFFERTVFF